MTKGERKAAGSNLIYTKHWLVTNATSDSTLADVLSYGDITDVMKQAFGQGLLWERPRAKEPTGANFGIVGWFADTDDGWFSALCAAQRELRMAGAPVENTDFDPFRRYELRQALSATA